MPAFNGAVDVDIWDFEDTTPALYGGTSDRAGERVSDARETARSIATRDNDPGLGITEPPRVLRRPRASMIVALAALATAALAGYVLVGSGRSDAPPAADGPTPSAAGGAQIAQAPSPGADQGERSKVVSNAPAVVPGAIGPAPVLAAPAETPETPALRESATAGPEPAPVFALPKAVAPSSEKLSGYSKLAAKPTKLAGTASKSTAKTAAKSGQQAVAPAERAAPAGNGNPSQDGPVATNPKTEAPMAQSAPPQPGPKSASSPTPCTDSMYTPYLCQP